MELETNMQGREAGPLVSIGMPCYNRPEGLRKALASLQAQAYSNLEIIVSDNCSPDTDVQKTVEEFMAAGMPILYHRQPENRGHAFNFRFVLEQSTGEYFMWLCDDDWISPNYVEACVSAFLADKDVMLASGAISAFRGAQEAIAETPFSRVKRYFLNFTRSHVMIFSLMPGEVARAHAFLPLFGADWVWVADFLFMGKLRVCREAQFFISDEGISKDQKHCAKTLGYSWFHHAAPALTVSGGYACHVFSGDPPYAGLPLWYRILLGTAGAFFILSASFQSIVLHLLKRILPAGLVAVLNRLRGREG